MTNEPSNILLIAFKNHHYPPRSAHVGLAGWLAGWEWEFVSVLGRGGGCDAESEAGPYSLGHINQ